MIIAIPSKFPNQLAERCPKLRLIQTFSAGTDSIDIKYLAENGIKVANNFGQNAITVAEHTIGLMISVYRNLPIQFTETIKGNWHLNISEKLVNNELAEKKIGIIGFGQIGQKVAQRLQGWECKLAYNDIVKFPKEIEEKFNIHFETKREIFLNSDIITLHVPLTPGTKSLVGKEELSLMKNSSILINTSRGAILDEEALEEALRNKDIAGAGLDVLVEEPNIKNDHRLLSIENLFITPHLAALSQESIPRIDKFMVNNVKRFLEGEPPISIVKAE